VIAARQNARAIGVARLVAESNSVGFFLLPDYAALAGEAVRDWARASRVAKSFATRYRAAVAADSATAVKKTAGAIQRIAATESSEAFSAGRAKALGLAPKTQLLRAWDAALDRRTCPTCSAADGTIVGVNEPFPSGEPGAVHPYCRCSWTLLTFDESGLIAPISP